MWPKATTAATARPLRGHAEKLGARIVTLNMPHIDVNIAAASEDMRALCLDHLERIIGLAGDLGTPGVVIGPGKANPLLPMPRDQLTGHFFRALERLVPLAKKAGTRLLVENMPFAFLPRIGDLMAALDKFGSDDIGLTTSGQHRTSRRLEDRQAAAGLVHLSDTGQQVYRHDPVGLGTVAFAVVPPVLDEIGPAFARAGDHRCGCRRSDRDSARRLVEAGFKASPR
jgi:sugar phosphate isomerase/epimerase